jgi:pimeloyl-ACP methyl ester carboxylesterase
MVSRAIVVKKMANSRFPPPGRLVNVGGRRFHIQVHGEGNPVVVLESGIAASSINWSMVQERVARFTTVLSYDRAGFGWSDAASGRATASESASELAGLLETIGLGGPYVLVGHSYGGLIVRLFQGEYPDRVAGLVLVDPVVRGEWRNPTEDKRRMLARGVSLSRRGALLARLGIVRAALWLLMHGSKRIPQWLARVSAGSGASVTDRLVGEVRKMPKEHWPAIAWQWSRAQSFAAMASNLESLPASARQLDETATLGDLPLIVLSAGKGVPEHTADARLSSRGEARVVPDAGHWIQLDAPDAVVAAIRQVCAR